MFKYESLIAAHNLSKNRREGGEKKRKKSARILMTARLYVRTCILNNIEAINRKRVNDITRRHRHVVHFNCLVVWSNSKRIWDLSIDSFAPRLWIKCFNYLCTDVRCLLECCMWCRPRSPLPPPLPPCLSRPPPPYSPSPPGMNGTWWCRQFTDRNHIQYKN